MSHTDEAKMGSRLIQTVAQRAYQLAESLLARQHQFHINRAYVAEESVFTAEFVQLVDRLTLDDIGLNAEKLSALSKTLTRPVMFMEVMEVPLSLNISAIALLGDQSDVPLHDHPGMHGCIKVLHGKVHLEGYTVVDQLADRPLTYWAEKNCDRLVTSADPPCVIGPKTTNLHKVTAVGGPAVFFDVLIPPYEPPDRDCRYFREIDATKVGKKLKLEEICVPNSYRTGVLHYGGPKINLFAKLT